MDDIEEVLDDAYARVQALDDAAHAEQLLGKGAAWASLIERARDDALAALNDLITMPAQSIEAVRNKQWEVQRYGALCRYITGILADGDDVREITSPEEEADLRELTRGEIEPEDA